MLNAPPISAPVAELTITGIPAVAPLIVTVPESQLFVNDVPVIVPVVPEAYPDTLANQFVPSVLKQTDCPVNTRIEVPLALPLKIVAVDVIVSENDPLTVTHV